MCFLCKFAKNNTTSGEAAVGTDIPVESIFWENNVKYLVNEGQATSLTVTKDGDNTLNIYVTPAALYTCMVNLKANSELLVSNSSSIYAEESSTIYYSKAYNKDGKWYVTNANNDQPYYGVTFNTVTEDNTVDITSFAENTSILYFAEAEDMSINGGFAADGVYPNICSNGKSKRLYKESYIYTPEFESGTYKVTLWARNNRSAAGNYESLELWLRDAEGNLTDLGISFENWESRGGNGEHSVIITIPDDGSSYSIVINNATEWNSNLEMDYVYIEKATEATATIGTTGFATFSSTAALDFTGVTDLTAWIATANDGSSVTLTQVTGAVAANTGLVLQGKSAAIPVATSGTEYTDNLLVAVSADQTVDAGYVLSVQEGNVVFAPIADTKPTVKAGQAYLKASDSAVNALSIVFGDATAISEVANNIVTKGECYDLTGRKVNLQSQKSIFIINGKKIIRK